MQRTPSATLLPTSQSSSPISSPREHTEGVLPYFPPSTETHGIERHSSLRLSTDPHRTALLEMCSTKTPMQLLTVASAGRALHNLLRSFNISVMDIAEYEHSTGAQFGYTAPEIQEKDQAQTCYRQVPEAAFFAGQCMLMSNGEEMDTRISLPYETYVSLSPRQRGLLEEIRGFVWLFTNVAMQKNAEKFNNSNARAKTESEASTAMYEFQQRKQLLNAVRNDENAWLVITNFVIGRREHIAIQNPENPLLALLCPTAEDKAAVVDLIREHYATL